MSARAKSPGVHTDRRRSDHSEGYPGGPTPENAHDAAVRYEAAASLAQHLAAPGGTGPYERGELVEQIDRLADQAHERLHLRSLRLVS